MLMKIVCAPDMFQSIMQDLIGHMDKILVYIDDAFILSREVDTELSISGIS